MVAPPLELVLELNGLVLAGFPGPYACAVEWWFHDGDHLVYDIGISTEARECRLLLVYSAATPLVPTVDVLDVSGPWQLLNARAPEEIIEDWILFGWRSDTSAASTIARALLWAGRGLAALHAEDILARLRPHRKRRAPEGLLVIHNTPQKNWQSICREGFRTCFSNWGQGVWVRPPSFGRIKRSRFRGNLSFLIDIGGLLLKRYSGYEMVVGEDIPVYRVQRIFDLDRKEDG